MNKQLALWDEPVAETPLPAIGETIEHVCSGWADGDTSQAALERLAHILLQPGTRLETFALPKGVYLDKSSCLWFITIATRIEGTQIIQTLERIKPLVTSGYADDPRDEEEEF